MSISNDLSVLGDCNGGYTVFAPGVNIDEENFILENYNHHPTIKADMIA